MSATKDKGSPSGTEQATANAAPPSSSEPTTGEMALTYDKSTGQVIRIKSVVPPDIARNLQKRNTRVSSDKERR